MSVPVGRSGAYPVTARIWTPDRNAVDGHASPFDVFWPIHRHVRGRGLWGRRGGMRLRSRPTCVGCALVASAWAVQHLPPRRGRRLEKAMWRTVPPRTPGWPRLVFLGPQFVHARSIVPWKSRAMARCTFAGEVTAHDRRTACAGGQVGICGGTQSPRADPERRHRFGRIARPVDRLRSGLLAF